jgi:polysaccharide export outer membrane protein
MNPRLIRAHLATALLALLPLTATVAAQDAAPQAEETGEWMHWTDGRYRITPGDVLEFTFPFVPELNQMVTVQPDGYISLKEIDDLRVQGRTLAQVKADAVAAYGAFVREPMLNVTLKEFEQPYFIAGGEVEKPGRYELRGATTVTQALAMAGGTRRGARTSHVTLYRRLPDHTVDVKQINVARMYARQDLSEDPLLRPGDTIVVPKSAFGKMLPLMEILRWR